MRPDQIEHQASISNTSFILEMPFAMDGGKELKHLYSHMRRHQLIGRPKSSAQWIMKALLNMIVILNLVRFAVLIWFPGGLRDYYLGNLMMIWGYNNSQMFFVASLSYGTLAVIFVIILEMAEHGSKHHFLVDNFDLENKMREWNFSDQDHVYIKKTTFLIIKTCRFMILTSFVSIFSVLFAALVFKIKASHLLIEWIGLISWYLLLCAFVQRVAAAYYFVIAMLFISVQVIRIRYQTLDRKLQQTRDERGLLQCMHEHDQISATCKSYNKSFKWMISAIHNLSTPSIAVAVYTIVYTEFSDQLLDKINAFVICSMIVVSTLMITFIPSGTARQSQSAFPIIMSKMATLPLSYRTRRRLLGFCKKISTQTTGHTGFSNGSSSTFTRGSAFGSVIATVSMWILYASMRQRV